VNRRGEACLALERWRLQTRNRANTRFAPTNIQVEREPLETLEGYFIVPIFLPVAFSHML
jgi:hypothetical protein